MKTLSGIFSFILILLALAFALSNRATATISLWPLGAKIEAPLYLLTLGTLLLGVLIGASVAWFTFLPHRMKAGRLRRDLEELQDKVSKYQSTVIPPVAAQSRDSGLRISGPKPKWRFWESRT